MMRVFLLHFKLKTSYGFICLLIPMNPISLRASLYVIENCKIPKTLMWYCLCACTSLTDMCLAHYLAGPHTELLILSFYFSCQKMSSYNHVIRNIYFLRYIQWCSMFHIRLLALIMVPSYDPSFSRPMLDFWLVWSPTLNICLPYSRQLFFVCENKTLVFQYK